MPEQPAASGYHVPPDPCERPTKPPPKPSDSRRSVSAKVETRPPLSSVGIVCICGKALASIEGIARTCACGRTWIVSVMLIGGDDA